ncbi:MAG: sigma-70 family RNA polymerase sigma factor [Bacilli bacterium]|nr:sigma-70 family RNA polymerase sigma factor [Bacilli bacterium]
MNNEALLKLIKENKNIICKVINKYTRYYEFDDLYQVSIIGIMKAYQNFKPEMGVKFTTYAYNYILSEVLFFVNNNRTIKVSREYIKVYKKILEARTLLTQKLMKEPTNYEISLFLEIDEAIINDVMRYQEKVKSLEEVIMDDGKKVTLLDQIATDNNINVDYISLHDGLSSLNAEEQQLINLRYFKDLTQSEIAGILGTNQVQISRNEQKILKKLKNNLCKTL